jgi:hypothetical protein
MKRKTLAAGAALATAALLVSACNNDKTVSPAARGSSSRNPEFQMPIWPRSMPAPTLVDCERRLPDRASAYFLPFSAVPPVDSAATKASCGTSTRPIVFIRFLPSFCFSSSLRLREMSPP